MADSRKRAWTELLSERADHRPVFGYTADALGRILFVPPLATFDVLTFFVRRVRARRAIRRLLGRAGDPIGIEGVVEARAVRVEGRVEALDSVATDEGRAVAAYVAQRVVREPCRCRSDCEMPLLILHGRSDSAPFLVHDESGVVLVDDPALVILDYRAVPLAPDTTDRLAVRSGDVVSVVGAAHRRAVADPRIPKTSTTYRDVGDPLVFDGTDGTPTHVFVER